MTHSNKLITTTTQLIQPPQIKQLLRGIAPNFTIKNYGGLQTYLTISGTNVQLQAGTIANVSTTLSSPLQWKSIGAEESIEDLLSGAKTSTTNTLFFLPEENADTLLTQPSQLRANLTDYVIEGYQIRELTSDNTLYGSLILHLPNYTITTNNFQTNTTEYLVESTFSNGSSKNQTTIGIFDTNSSLSLPAGYLSIQDSHTTDNNIGFRGNFKNITLFAQGEQVGEATKKYGSELLINLGDPLLKKYDTNPTVYDTNYDGGLGTEIFSDPDATIFKVKSLDFNKDNLPDLLVVYTDGTVKLAKNYGHGSGASFKNLENLMLISVGIKDVYIGDVDGNNYEDIIIATTTNQLRVYRNSNGKFEVDGELVCLNTNVNLGEQTSTPSELSVHQMFVEDMDKDGAMDILTNDYKGFVKIFYGGSTNEGGNY
ncbi:MAG: VCBS repeat-containing protein, partial [Candidatus Peribacteria bacterium]|nr:VCBS repeat-containing protein [Candidatus Peribacteria bacterium]